jgi:hypothetical protein
LALSRVREALLELVELAGKILHRRDGVASRFAVACREGPAGWRRHGKDKRQAQEDHAHEQPTDSAVTEAELSMIHPAVVKDERDRRSPSAIAGWQAHRCGELGFLHHRLRILSKVWLLMAANTDRLKGKPGQSGHAAGACGRW